MIQAFLIKPYSSLEPVVEIPLNVGVTELSLAMDMRQPYILKMRVTQAMGQMFFDLKENKNVGVRIRQIINNVVEWDIAFVKQDLDQTDENIYESSLLFRSTSVWLESNAQRQINFYKNYDEFSAKTIVQSITNAFNWEVTGEPLVSFQTGEFNSLQLLNEVTDTVGNWNWIEGSILSNKPTIVVGDFSNAVVSGYASKADINNIDPNLIKIIEPPVVRYNGKVVTHMLVTGSISSGTSATEAARIFLNPTVSTIAGFPIVDLGERTVGGKVLYRIVNEEAYGNIGYKILDQDVIEFSNNVVDENNRPIINNLQAVQSVYRQAVAKMKKQNFYVSYDFKFVFPKVFLAGSRILVNYKDVAFTSHGQKMEINLVDYPVFLKNMEFNLLEYVE